MNSEQARDVNDEQAHDTEHIIPGEVGAHEIKLPTDRDVVANPVRPGQYIRGPATVKVRVWADGGVDASIE